MTRPTGDQTVHYQPPRRRRRRRDVNEGLSLNVTPMIDVVFLLLIFFTVGASFARPEGYFASKLPRDVGAAGAMALPISPVIVRLGLDDPKGIGYSMRIDNLTDPPRTFDELAAMLRDIQSRPGYNADTPVVIVPDERVPWDHVVNCWNAAVRASCRQIMFGG